MCDSTLLSDRYQEYSMYMLSLSHMISLELPSVNIISKIDIGFPKSGDRERSERFRSLCDVLFPPQEVYEDDLYDFEEDQEDDDEHRSSAHSYNKFKHDKLGAIVRNTMAEFSLVSFIPFSLFSSKSHILVLSLCDKSLGYLLGLLGDKKGEEMEYLWENVQSECQYLGECGGYGLQDFLLIDGEEEEQGEEGDGEDKGKAAEILEEGEEQEERETDSLLSKHTGWAGDDDGF
ncbi:putative multi-domain containing protein [Aduncisulcus paluster]|uniref:Multi-domain containing protein n=1 Tax=Aduncisulcus paluster TaxID=2918883 RepID=A0ABQ5KXF5_9EUKA|nr:putative multi-domain containing protein [Aduncisulcus paluster]